MCILFLFCQSQVWILLNNMKTSSSIAFNPCLKFHRECRLLLWKRIQTMDKMYALYNLLTILTSSSPFHIEDIDIINVLLLFIYNLFNSDQTWCPTRLWVTSFSSLPTCPTTQTKTLLTQTWNLDLPFWDVSIPPRLSLLKKLIMAMLKKKKKK